MKTTLILALGWCCAVSGEKANPLGAVLGLLGELEAKITKDGDVEANAYSEYFEWCDEATKNTGFAIETASNEKAQLEAKIGELSSDVAVATSKIEELGAAVATSGSELKDATAIRDEEAADFATSEKELMEAISAVSRASSILEKEMAKNPASFAQLNTADMSKAIQAIGAVLDAASFSGNDQKKLMALVQSQENSDDEDVGAPSAASYKTHSNGILDVLEDLKEKAEGQLSDLRKAEVNARHNYEMLKQSLEDQLAADSKDMDEEKAGKAAAEESKATAQGDLEVAVKELASSNGQLATARSTCLQTSADHEATVAARKEELAVLAQAKKILKDTSSGAVSQTYSFLQFASRMQTHADLVGREVVVAVRKLAKKQHSPALAQLASRIAAVARFGTTNGEAPFAKVKGLIQDMIAKLEGEAGADATEKAYCDEQMAKTSAKKSDLEDDVSKMSSKIDQASAKSAQLKEEIQELEGQLASLAKEQAEMDGIRQGTNADYKAAKADLELGLSGIRKALGVLREYYGAGSASMLQDASALGAAMEQPTAPVQHSQSAGAGGSIIDILEVVESDFATNLAKEETEEADAQSEYETVSQQNEVTETLKTQDVKYKTQESKSLDKTASEYSADRETTNTELSAVDEYFSKIKERCIAKPEAYSVRKSRREAEISGLKQALSILEDETAFVQRKKHGSFRGSLAAH